MAESKKSKKSRKKETKYRMTTLVSPKERPLGMAFQEWVEKGGELESITLSRIIQDREGRRKREEEARKEKKTKKRTKKRLFRKEKDEEELIDESLFIEPFGHKGPSKAEFKPGEMRRKRSFTPLAPKRDKQKRERPNKRKR